MINEQPDKQVEGEQAMSEYQVEKPKTLLPFLPSEVQLQNVFAIEIVARRFPVETDKSPLSSLNVEDVLVNDETHQAQVMLEVKLDFAEEPRPFEMSFKLLGQFIYGQHLEADQVRLFLSQGSLSVMLPFAREYIFSLCTRLQIPPIMLAMVKLVPPPSVDRGDEEIFQ